MLLDALKALRTHRDTIVVVGAQAIDLRAGEADLGVAPDSTDDDPALASDLLAEILSLKEAIFLIHAGQPVIRLSSLAAPAA